MFLETAGAAAIPVALGAGLLYWRERALLRSRDRLERQAVQRDRATAVADLMAKWVGPSYGIEKASDRHRWELQKEYWRVALWLDSDTLRTVASTLSKDPTANLDVHDAIAAARAAIVGDEERPIMGNDLNRWPPESKHP